MVRLVEIDVGGAPTGANLVFHINPQLTSADEIMLPDFLPPAVLTGTGQSEDGPCGLRGRVRQGATCSGPDT